jgi:hypothetical protein
MSTTQALELAIFFLQEAFSVPRESLLQNKHDQELRDSTLLLLNSNLLLFEGLALLNQHVSFNFEYLLRPQEFS